jgi:hypothetical protein
MQLLSGLLLAASLLIMMRGIRPRFRAYRLDRATARWIKSSLR